VAAVKSKAKTAAAESGTAAAWWHGSKKTEKTDLGDHRL